MYQFFSAKKIIELLEQHQIPTIASLMEIAEAELTHRSIPAIRENMGYRLQVMREAIIAGKSTSQRSPSTLSGGDSVKMAGIKESTMFLSEVARRAMEYALAVMESNARMGKIVAAPTAGSAGIIPGGILATQECFGLSEDTAIDGLLTASAVGIIIAHKATFSAAKAGCQAEVGSSTAMAAAALGAMRGFSPAQCLNAAAIALKNLLGLACDPIGGYVEVPCVKRNAIGISHAMTACDMTLAGIISVVPFDEVVLAMNDVAQNMHSNIRETSRGGLAITPTAQKIVLGDNLQKGMSCHKNQLDKND